MKERRPIDIKRESSGSLTIGTEDDGAIVEMFEFEGKLICLKERAIYEFMFADRIDPERTNINLQPNAQRLILNQGTESELVSRVFITAKRLFKTEYLKKEIDTVKALSLALEALQEMAVLEIEINEYLQLEEKENNEYEDGKAKNSNFKIPSISDVETRCKTIYQKADHIEQIMLDLVSIFYPDDKNNNFEIFEKFLLEKYGENDRFYNFIKEVRPFLLLVRSLRNCLDHRLPHVKVYNYELLPSGDINTPSIELNYRDSQLNRNSLFETLNVTKKNLVMIFEHMVAYLADKSVRNKSHNRVNLIPEETRTNKFAKYSFWSPFGEGGFYHQN
ncbi:hypothetical protein B4Q04_10760 [Zobellia sp. OII3]|uniref:hypothetical protein n=1 Tax=Zobellia sp. OII3 TaxID=2034520 RepID=UPI000B53299B|nr:hypothetical protein [Zobellia sp. OII3]OWW25023.1 hypothetical protein B4Q04_10760 [Zobellia sp. OII3]